MRRAHLGFGRIVVSEIYGAHSVRRSARGTAAARAACNTRKALAAMHLECSGPLAGKDWRFPFQRSKYCAENSKRMAHQEQLGGGEGGTFFAASARSVVSHARPLLLVLGGEAASDGGEEAYGLWEGGGGGGMDRTTLAMRLRANCRAPSQHAAAARSGTCVARVLVACSLDGAKTQHLNCYVQK